MGTPHEPRQLAAPEQGAEGAQLWVSSALLCVPPVPTSSDRAHWRLAEGGSIHPVKPRIRAPRFPFETPLAVHIRVQGSGDAALTVGIFDQGGSHLTWGEGHHEPTEEEVSIPDESEAEGTWEDASTVILPRVRFPSAGRYVVRVRLLSLKAREELDRVDLPMQLRGEDMQGTSRSAAGQSPRLLEVMEQLRLALNPESQRVLRLAGMEALRLSHRSVGTEHLLVSLRRVLGSRSNLPRTSLLREALERINGRYLGREQFGDLHITPAAIRFLRDSAAARDGYLSPEGMLQSLLASDSCPTLVAAEARLLHNLGRQ